MHTAVEAEFIEQTFSERYTLFDEGTKRCQNVTRDHTITTATKVPKLGLMLVGLGGNNGSTLVAGLLANKKKLTYETK